MCPYSEFFWFSLEGPNTHPILIESRLERVKRVRGGGAGGGNRALERILEIAVISRADLFSSKNVIWPFLFDSPKLKSNINRANKQYWGICIICVNLETPSSRHPKQAHSDQQGAIDYNS